MGDTYHFSRYAQLVEFLLVVGAGLRAVIGDKDKLLACVMMSAIDMQICP